MSAINEVVARVGTYIDRTERMHPDADTMQGHFADIRALLAHLTNITDELEIVTSAFNTSERLLTESRKANERLTFELAHFAPTVALREILEEHKSKHTK